MKRKFMLKKLAVALAAAYTPMVAVAAITANISLNDPNDPDIKTFASELLMTDNNPLQNSNDILNFSVNAGFQINQSEVRYMRFDFENAKLDDPFAATDIEAGGTHNFSQTEVAGFGAAGDSVVIFKVTGPAGAGQKVGASDPVMVKMPHLRVIDNNMPVKVTYTMYTDIGNAASKSSPMVAVTGVIAKFDKGFDFKFDHLTATASSTEGFKKFCADSSCGNKTLYGKVGKVTYKTVAGVNGRDHNAVSLSSLIKNAKLILKGNFSAAESVHIDTTNAADCLTKSHTATITNNNQATFTFNQSTIPITGGVICYKATGATMIPAQSIMGQLDIVETQPDVDMNDVADAPVGSIVYDGVVLKFPYLAPASGQLTWVQLTNIGATDASFTTTCYKDNGSAAATGLSGTVPAGQSKKITAATLCPAGTKSVTITANVPAGQLIGSAVRVHNTSGATAMDGATGNQ